MAPEPSEASGRASRERGAIATEYALLAAFIALAIAVALDLYGTNLAGYFMALATRIGNALN